MASFTNSIPIPSLNPSISTTSSEFLNTLSNDLSWLLDNTEDCDVILQVGQEPNIRKFYAHIALLRARSSYFRLALSKEWAKREEDGLVLFHKPNIYPEIFEEILKYIYKGTVDLDEQNGRNLLNLLTAGDELMLDQFCSYIQAFLIERKFEWLEENLVDVLRTTQNYNNCTALREHCLELIAERPASIFRSEGFVSLDKELLISLLKRDDLEMDEVEIWNYVVKWGISNTPDLLELDKEKWTEENYEALSDTLSQYIPLIRFFDISSSDFYDWVRPYDKILPKDLNEDIVRYHFKPGSIPHSIVLPPRDQGMNLDSLIIKPIHARLICGWIDGKDILGPTYVKATYDFRLLVRGTRDGFDATTFHTRCDRKGATVVVMKLEGSGEILGGYNAAYWRTGAVYIQSDKSFIFSLRDGKNLQEVRLSRVKDSSSAMYGHTSYGPHFGTADLRMYSLFNNSENCSCQQASYYKSITEQVRFAAEEYEVFQVVQK
ncbi:6481_t:CDS:2 [Acaulospora colombiana]|uniref:6481_t:CDS:1 n=1 Tax=Acaulospora colombiana TaxID=27376 RepID=A0ACA9KSD1_9GLOM|nr:6481_t:CDS:2 [Acaulospora colombiana]